MATLRLGQYVTEQIGKKRSLKAILAEGEEQQRQAGREYADVRQLGPVRTMKIPDNGVW